jgi:glycosyltransferase involved in cell wall biosynthesis
MQNKEVKFSFIIPVYNRPDEVDELLESMQNQSKQGFEVVIVEDGSQIKCDHILEKYHQDLEISYFFKPNSGPGQSRNYGYKRAKGNYCIFLDSDVVLPVDYFKTVTENLENEMVDAFGGPDEAHNNFTPIQKAINYSMTSFLTTGGIRGGNERVDKFYPRSFNMGYTREVFEKTGGFAKMRFGEDIDMSIRILANGFKTKLIKEAFVYHKRRTNLRQFFKQVSNSGIARINLYKRHPQSLKLVHLAPAVFTIGFILLLFFSLLWRPYFLLFILFYSVLLFLDSSIKNKSPYIGFLSIITGNMQLLSYGFGFLFAVWRRLILGKDEFAVFERNFYK